MKYLEYLRPGDTLYSAAFAEGVGLLFRTFVCYSAPEPDAKTITVKDEFDESGVPFNVVVGDVFLTTKEAAKAVLEELKTDLHCAIECKEFFDHFCERYKEEVEERVNSIRSAVNQVKTALENHS